MIIQTRNTKVFVSALISILAGLIILQSLDTNPPLADAFSLSDYYDLEPIEDVITSRTQQFRDRWSRINIVYSQTKAGDIDQLCSLSGLANPEDINYHFVICNGFGGANGLIQPTEKWQRQWSITLTPDMNVGMRAIRICIICDGKETPPTEFQIRRTEELLEQLSRKFNIQPEAITYPENW
jgi:hypothetical protein